MTRTNIRLQFFTVLSLALSTLFFGLNGFRRENYILFFSFLPISLVILSSLILETKRLSIRRTHIEVLRPLLPFNIWKWNRLIRLNINDIGHITIIDSGKNGEFILFYDNQNHPIFKYRNYSSLTIEKFLKELQKLKIDIHEANFYNNPKFWKKELKKLRKSGHQT